MAVGSKSLQGSEEVARGSEINFRSFIAEM